MKETMQNRQNANGTSDMRAGAFRMQDNHDVSVNNQSHQLYMAEEEASVANNNQN